MQRCLLLFFSLYVRARNDAKRYGKYDVERKLIVLTKYKNFEVVKCICIHMQSRVT